MIDTTQLPEQQIVKDINKPLKPPTSSQGQYGLPYDTSQFLSGAQGTPTSPPPGGTTPQTNITGGVPMPWQWGVAGQALGRQAYGQPLQTPYPWSYGTSLAERAGATGLPTQVPSPWLQGITGTQQTMQTGLPTQTPDIWGAEAPLVTQMAQTGRPTSQDPWYQQAKQVAAHDIAQQIGQAAETAGLKGMRWSSPLARQAQEIAAQRMGEVGLEWTGRELGALEAARQRQLQAMPLQYQLGAGMAGLSEAARQRQFGALPLQLQFGQGLAGLGEAAAQRQMQALSPLYQFGAGQAGLGESAQQRALQAAGQLMPLGQMAAQHPLNVAQQMLGMGGQLQQQQMAAIAPLYQHFMTQTPEASPWLQYAMGATQMPFTQAPQQYQASPFSQLLGILGMIPGLF